jgi:hypothetical protein
MTFHRPELREFAELLFALIQRGEVIKEGLAVSLPGIKRVVVSAIDHRVKLSSPDGLTIARDRLGLIRQVNPEIEKDACPQLWDLIVMGRLALGWVDIASKDPAPNLVIDNANDHVRIRCSNTVLEIDYPGSYNPDIDEVRVYEDRIVVIKTGPDVTVTF